MEVGGQICKSWKKRQRFDRMQRSGKMEKPYVVDVVTLELVLEDKQEVCWYVSYLPTHLAFILWAVAQMNYRSWMSFS